MSLNQFMLSFLLLLLIGLQNPRFPKSLVVFISSRIICSFAYDVCQFVLVDFDPIAYILSLSDNSNQSQFISNIDVVVIIDVLSSE
jgi:hypothetical protein